MQAYQAGIRLLQRGDARLRRLPQPGAVAGEIARAQAVEQLALRGADLEQREGVPALERGLRVRAQRLYRPAGARKQRVHAVAPGEVQHRVERIAPDQLLAGALVPLVGIQRAEGVQRVPGQAGQALARARDVLRVGLRPLPARLREDRQQAEAQHGVRLRAVVAPERRQHGVHPAAGAGAQRGAHGRAGAADLRQKAAPRPDAAGEDRLPAHARVLGKHVVVEGLVRVIVIPVAHRHVGRQAADDAVRHDGLRIVIVAAGTAQAEEHVAPHDWLQPLRPADVRDAPQVAGKQLKAVRRPVDGVIPPQPHAVRLVHADVDAARAHAAAHRPDLRLDEGVRLRLVGQQHVRQIAQGRRVAPLQKLRQVRQRLDAGHQLHAQRGGIRVQPAQLCLRVAAAQIAEGRILRHLKGVLGVEHQQVHAQRGDPVDRAAHGLHLHHGAAGHVQHHAARFEAALLADLLRRPALAHGAREQEKPARQGVDVVCRDGRAVRPEADDQRILPACGHGDGPGERYAGDGFDPFARQADLIRTQHGRYLRDGNLRGGLKRCAGAYIRGSMRAGQNPLRMRLFADFSGQWIVFHLHWAKN